jgi:hypothetical protein
MNLPSPVDKQWHLRPTPVCAYPSLSRRLTKNHINAALNSALTALESVGGEVILADSGSTDRTVEIARGYPVEVLQLKHPAERRCGIGPQLGYQRAMGEFVYMPVATWNSIRPSCRRRWPL